MDLGILKPKSPPELPPIRIGITIEVATGTPMKYKWTPNFLHISPTASRVRTCQPGVWVCIRGPRLTRYVTLVVPWSDQAHRLNRLILAEYSTSKVDEMHGLIKAGRSRPDCSNSTTTLKERCLISILFPKPWDIRPSFN